MTFFNRKILAGFAAALAAYAFSLPASAKIYNLVIARTPVNITGTPTTAITVNGQLPAPTLHWQDGEQVVIHVTNKLKVPTSLHWHGILVPAAMDGVPGISFDGIAPGTTFTYHFTVRQSGTYWYHSHSGGQEQEGLYGAIVITPNHPPLYHYSRDYVVMLSDWSNESPHQILSNLKSQSDYYNYAQRTVPGFFHAVATQGWAASFADRLAWGGMRMSPTDISDVSGATYTYLMEGKTAKQNWTALYTPGQSVRLRLINASSMTYFDVRIPGLKMTVVQVDGQNVKPVTVDEIRMGVASTYDVLVTPKDGRAYTIFAESMDRSGYARGTLAPRAGMTATVPPMDPRPVLSMRAMGMSVGGMQGMGDMPGMGMGKPNSAGVQHPPATKSAGEEGETMPGMNMGQMTMAPAATSTPAMNHMDMKGMPMSGMTMPAAATTMAAIPIYSPSVQTGVGVAHIAPDPVSLLDDPGVGLRDNGRKVLTYAELESLTPHPDPKPDRTLVLHLTGNMQRYMWSFNGKKYADSTPIVLRYGERIRIEFINDTMMDHPIHLHGVFMELENGHGTHNPLLHTVNVQPGEKLSVLVTADNPGGWALHCHLQYHMESGMFREVLVSPPPGYSDAAAVLATPAFSDWRQPKAAAPPPAHERMTLGDTMRYHQIMLDQLEYQSGSGDSPNAFAWEGQAWYGGDINKLWLKTEGSRSNGHTEDADVEALYDRAVTSFFDVQTGVRHDFGSGPARNWAAFGIQGLASYFFDLELTGYLGPDGRTAARARVRYELLFTQRLILEPELEINWYGRDDPARRIGSGFSDASLGLRLRYEFSRKFAPYIGVQYERTFGHTGDYLRAAGERTGTTELLAGLRTWF